MKCLSDRELDRLRRAADTPETAGTVGLLLAFAVAAMPSPTGKHYYFEIMLPGAIVGAIVGYATQRHRGAVPAKAGI